MKWTATNGKRPRTGEKPLWCKFRNGTVLKEPYRADQVRWTDTGDEFDIVEVARA